MRGEVRQYVLVRRLAMAPVHVELAKDGGEVGVHRPELRLVRIEAVQHDGVEALGSNGASGRARRRRFEETPGVNDSFSLEAGAWTGRPATAVIPAVVAAAASHSRRGDQA